MKNTVTLDQFRKLESLCWQYQEKNHPDRDDEFLLCMLTTAEGDGPEPEETAEMMTLEAYDWDGCTDFDLLRQLLKEAGIELDEKTLLSPYEVNRLQNDDEWTPQAYITDGDASYGNRSCSTYAYCLPLKK